MFLPLFQALVFGFKTTCVLFFYVWVRSAFPRYRYDQLQYTFWKGILPITLGLLLFLMSTLYTLDFLPA
jgi:NADH:ubiquinone oxidoreductase subunit H